MYLNYNSSFVYRDIIWQTGFPTPWMSRSCDLPTVCSRWPPEWRIYTSQIKLIQLASHITLTALSEDETTIRATLAPVLKRNVRIIVEDAVGVMD